MNRCLNHPQRIILHRVFVTRNLLLLVTPFRQFYFVGEEVTASQGVPQPENGA